MQLNFTSLNESLSSFDQDAASISDSASQFMNSSAFFESSKHHRDPHEEDDYNNDRL